MSSDHDNIIDGYKHFKDFYGKLNVLSEINKINKNVKQTLEQSVIHILTDKNIDEITNKQHSSEELIKTFSYTTEKEKHKIRDTELQVGSIANPITIKISKDVTITDKKGEALPKDESESRWFNLFRDRGDTKDPNIIDFNSTNTGIEKPPKDTDIHPYHHITNLFNFDDKGTSWHSKVDMLALFNRPFLLLTFEMKYYNHYGLNLFQTNFDVISRPRNWKNLDNGEFVTLESLIYIEQFSRDRRPTFLMLLIYYAGYNFKITKDDIIRKFRNKFSQSSNGMSFEIKSYIQEADSLETKYNNKIRSTIKPTCVNLEAEELLVYHVGGKIESLWDYVNGKLTILINNMLNSKDKGDYTNLFNKQYTSNSLFLFECISELKKYKEYISNLNPENLKAIAYPMSTLKTLEILILKLSYILNILEPTFIPIETMSFDVTIDGKKLKYVINSELQATNIGIDDYISNNKLMAAITSLRDLKMPDEEKAKTMFSRQEENNIFSKLLQKEAANFKDMSIRKSIDIQRIKQHRDRLVKEKPDDAITPEIQTIEKRLEKETANLANIRSKVDSAIYIITAIKEKTFNPDMLKQFNEIVVSDLPTEEFHNDDPRKVHRQHKHHSGHPTDHSRHHTHPRGHAIGADPAQSSAPILKDKNFNPDMPKQFNEIVVSNLPTEEFHNDDPRKVHRQHKHHSGHPTDHSRHHRRHRYHSKKRRHHIPSDIMLNDDKAAKLPPKSSGNMDGNNGELGQQ